MPQLSMTLPPTPQFHSAHLIPSQYSLERLALFGVLNSLSKISHGIKGDEILNGVITLGVFAHKEFNHLHMLVVFFFQ